MTARTLNIFLTAALKCVSSWHGRGRLEALSVSESEIGAESRSARLEGSVASLSVN